MPSGLSGACFGEPSAINMPIQLIFLAIVILALGFTWRRVKQNAIRSGEGLLWAGVWIAIGIVVLIPEITSRIANAFGVGRGADFVVYGSIIVLFLLVFQSHIAAQRLERALTELVSRQALRDLEIEQTKTPRV